MRVLVSQESLSSSLSVVSRAVSSSAIRNDPALGGVFLRAEKDVLALSATDKDFSVKAEIAAQIEVPGELLLSAKHLGELVRRFDGDTIEIVKEGDSAARIRQGRKNFSLQGMPVEAFPELEEPFGSSLVLPKEKMGRLVRHVLPALSKDTSPSRIVLSGAWFHCQGENIEMISSDGVRVAIAGETIGGSNFGEVEAVLPGRALQELVRILGNEGNVELLLGERLIFIRLGDVTFATRRMEENYPKVKEYLPKEYVSTVRVSKGELEKAIERINLIAREVETSPMDLSLEDGKVVMRAESPQIGTGYEEVLGAKEGADASAMFNTRYLLDGVRGMEAEGLILEAAPDGRALSITPEGRPSYKYVVLPMRREKRGI